MAFIIFIYVNHRRRVFFSEQEKLGLSRIRFDIYIYIYKYNRLHMTTFKLCLKSIYLFLF